MTGLVVVDTDVVSFLFKGDSRASAYRQHLEGYTLALSFMPVAELYQWAYQRAWGETAVLRLEERMRTYVIIPYDAALCRWWAQVSVTRRQAGRPISVQDGRVAATALHCNCPLVTHNRADFLDIPGLHVISEA